MSEYGKPFWPKDSPFLPETKETVFTPEMAAKVGVHLGPKDRLVTWELPWHKEGLLEYLRKKVTP